MTNKELEEEVRELRKLDDKVNKIIKSLIDYSSNKTHSVPMTATFGAITLISRDIKLKMDMEGLENG